MSDKSRIGDRMGAHRSAMSVLYGVARKDGDVSADDPAEKIRLLAEKALSTKRQAFERVKAEDKAAADFLRDVSALFGKPQAIAIRFADGSTFRLGHFGN